jgi:hypothetical protein
MRQWLLTHGTQHQFTAPYTSAQNGRVERLHHTLMGKVCAMCSACSVLPNRWDEFVLTACYLSNRTPVVSQSGHTPFECWYSHKPDLSHLCEICCRAFVLIQNRHNPKIYDWSVECVLIGYSLDSKAYRCYHRETHKVFVSYHISFIESHHASALPLHPGVVLPNPTTPSVPSPTPPSQRATVENAPEEPDPPPLPRRSARVPVPTEWIHASKDLPYTTTTQ